MSRRTYYSYVLFGALTAAIRVNTIAGEDAFISWSMEQKETGKSCVLTISGDTPQWVSTLDVKGAEFRADAVCVNKTDALLGSVVANPIFPDLLMSHDKLTNSIVSVRLANEGELEFIFPMHTKVRSLAVDEQSQTVYYIDGQAGLILSQISFPNSHFITLVTMSDLTNPRQIVLDPDLGYIFLLESTVGQTTMDINRFNMVGESKSTIHSGLSNDTLLTIDRVNQRLYFLKESNGAGVLQYSTYTGTVQTVKELPNLLPSSFSGLTINQGYMFGTMADNATLLIWDINTGKKMAELGFPITNVAQYGITSTNALNVTRTSPCATNNGGCNQICVQDKKNSRLCRCILGFNLHSDGTSCTASYLSDNFLLLSDIEKDTLYQISEAGKVSGIPIEPTDNQRVETVLYSEAENKVIWIDTGNGTLRSKALKDGGEEQVIYAFPEGSVVEGLALDSKTQRVYYTDLGKKEIGFIQLPSGSQKTILTLGPSDSPSLLQLDEVKGVIYWTNVGPTPKIEKVKTNGDDRFTLVDQELSEPSGLAINLRDSKLYYADGKKGHIGEMNLDGTGRLPFAELSDVYSLAFSKDSLYAARTHGVMVYPHLERSKRKEIVASSFSMTFGLSSFTTEAIVTTSVPSTTTPSGASMTKSTVMVQYLVLVWTWAWLLLPGFSVQ